MSEDVAFLKPARRLLRWHSRGDALVAQSLAAPSSTFSQENCLFIVPAQLQPICPSAVLGPNQGNPGYSIMGTDTVDKCCGQAGRNTIARLPVTEHLLQGRTTNQLWVLPRLLKPNSHKTAPGVYNGRSMPGTCSRCFHSSSCTGNRIPKHEAGGVKMLGVTLIPFSGTFLVSSSTSPSPFNRGYRIQIGKILI